MKFTCQVEINAPIEKVIELFDNPDNLKDWQDGFISYEHLNGTPGQKDAKSKLIYKAGRKTIELIETIITNKLPEEFTALYEAKQMVNTMTNRFLPKGNNTLYVADIEYTQFNGLMLKLMIKLAPGMFRKQAQKWLDQFKDFVERKAND